VPVHYAARGVAPPPDLEFGALHHNCSGKHAGFLACCRLHGLPLDSYLAADHPLQQRIRRMLASVAGVRRDDDMPLGIDGCGAPNYALPLRSLARAYARLASERDGEFGAAFATLFDAMSGAPEMVSGLLRSDATLMQAAPGEWVTKGGAEGVQALGIRTAGLGIAVKISDGNAAALRAATAAVLEALGLMPAEAPALRQWSNAELRNHSGTLVGRLRAVFRMERPAL
jgi:L-asparaginase II